MAPRLVPRGPVPALALDTLGDARWVLAERKPGKFLLVAFYRGLHCPICKGWLGELDKLQDELGRREVESIAVSCDERERAQRARDDWGLVRLAIGYGLAIDAAREWGLFISSGRGTTSAGVEEPALFAEPGVFLIRPGGELYASVVSSMPFARPHFREILQAVDFIVSKDYPARGEA
jgi:peroxiredoxin